jgi:hypothetical protein
MIVSFVLLVHQARQAIQRLDILPPSQAIFLIYRSAPPGWRGGHATQQQTDAGISGLQYG